jgi:alpha-mannosidase
MTREPELKFVCSQAQQHEWMRERYPNIFEQMVEQAAAGRFTPVGGMWVEADTNLPSGESLARQFLHGQRFFEQHYGAICEEVWIPDVFGYPASLPQIFALGGAKWFLTQKLSWNKQNRMPHHTFWWQGIDGTRMFTHFPPVDTYNVSMQPAQLAHAERNYADHGGGTMSMAPFGFGNGGGGPTRDMMERYRRMRDLEGLPRMVIESPADFFEAAVADYPDASTWVGELYFEMHRGTYTSQAKTKSGNRRTEVLLGDVELWSALAARVAGAVYPLIELEAAWRETLTLQFHDIIPGSSIAWVHDDAEAAYERLTELLGDLRTNALTALTQHVGGDMLLANSAPDARCGVVEVSGSLASTVAQENKQWLHDSRAAIWADVPALGVTGISGTDRAAVGADIAVSVVEQQSVIVVANEFIRVTIDEDGLLSSVFDLRANREVVKAGHRANVLELSADHPVEYDAWDLDDYYAKSTQELIAVDSIEVLDSGPLVATVAVTRTFGASQIVQQIVIRAGSARIDVVNDVSWYEDEKVLKVAMPVDVHADTAACDIQFGHVHRPTHASTSWDAAKFEVCAHRWVDVSEADYGVALLNDSKYGHDVHRGALRLTLLRASNYPDPDADRGEHHFTYALLPHLRALAQSDVIAEAARLNQPVVAIAGVSGGASTSSISAIGSSNPQVVITAVKQAEDGTGDVVVRCYEASGGRATATLTGAFAASSVVVCDFLERALPHEADAASFDGHTLTVHLRPFQIVTLRLIA